MLMKKKIARRHQFGKCRTRTWIVGSIDMYLLFFFVVISLGFVSLGSRSVARGKRIHLLVRDNDGIRTLQTYDKKIYLKKRRHRIFFILLRDKSLEEFHMIVDVFNTSIIIFSRWFHIDEDTNVKIRIKWKNVSW